MGPNKKMKHNSDLPTQPGHNVIEYLYYSLNSEQKQELNSQFIEILTNKYQSENCMPTEIVFHDQIENIYTEENFHRMQHYLEYGAIREDTVGILGYLWFELFIEFVSKIHGAVVL